MKNKKYFFLLLVTLTTLNFSYAQVQDLGTGWLLDGIEMSERDQANLIDLLSQLDNSHYNTTNKTKRTETNYGELNLRDLRVVEWVEGNSNMQRTNTFMNMRITPMFWSSVIYSWDEAADIDNGLKARIDQLISNYE